jgi:hypothetical protein
VSRRMLATHGLLTLMVVSLLLAVAGCGTDRQVAPSSSVSASDQGVWVKDLASSGVGPLAQGVKPPKGGGSTGNAAGTIAPSSATINGAVGGVLSNDRFTLVLSPGAFAGSQRISIEVNNANGYVECYLFPEGLQFDQPALLSMSLLSTTGDSQATTIYWHDPATDTWVDMMGTYDASAHSVVARLQHFSDYRAGRAGW